MYRIWNNVKTTALMASLMGLCLAVGYLLRGRAALLLLILAPLAAALIQLAISRSREFEADRLGAGLAGTGRGLAQALRRLESANRRIPLRVPDSHSNMFTVAPLTGSDAAKLFMTHPSTEERIERLMAME